MPGKKALSAAELAAVHMIMPGEHWVSTSECLIGTLLGSCVAACMWDPELKIGGMNHFMLPDAPLSAAPDGAPARYGLYAMEVLINDLLRKGCSKERIQTKVFGGANMTGSVSNNHVGARNARFVLRFLADDGFVPQVADLGGENCRRIYFNSATGAVRVAKVRSSAESDVLQLEKHYSSSISQTDPGGDLTFF